MNKDDLEMMIDKFGLSKVLFFIAEICHEKSDHVQTNWQDNNLAKEWTVDAKAIERLAAKTRVT
jgi:hypothetical protein